MRYYITILLLFFAAGIFAQKTNHKKTTATTGAPINLIDAVAQKKVSVEVVAGGGYTGEALKIVCKNLSGKYLKLRVPQGQLMDPADSTMQTLVVAREKLLSVQAKTPAETWLQTFCTQAGDASPAAGTIFSISAMAPDKLIQLLKYMTEKNMLDGGHAQAAVWAVSSGSTLGAVGDPALRRFTAELTGKKAPAYHIKYEMRDEPGRATGLGKPMEFNGNFQYIIDTDDYLSLILYDANGKEVKVLRKDDFARAGEHRSSLSAKLWNLQPGKYFVRLKRKNGAVIGEMEIEF